MPDDSIYATPTLIAIKGGWMAKSAPGSRLHIGTVGETKEQAEAAFMVALAAWVRLMEIEKQRASVA